tara:strand:+ start:531 stop:1541 length:1011 start_codon:yes stop_codon:yes gene_type:complete
MTIFITGAAGFIGFHLSKRLIKNGNRVIGIDNLNDYYDPKLKEARIEILKSYKDLFFFKKINLEDKESLKGIFLKYKPEIIVNLAAQAGVRYSLQNPYSYIESNIVGFLNLLEECRRNNVKHLVYASSSSVYGGNTQMPFVESQNVDHPISLYAASKKSNELMAHSYSHLFGIPTTGLRFFTVYGPWGRPDMALFLFTKNIISNKPIKIFNNGKMTRDFTYIDDIVESIIRVIKKPPKKDNTFDFKNLKADKSWAPYNIFNIGNSNPTPLMEFINSLEKKLDKKAIKQYLPIQPGDVPSTESDTKSLEKWIDFKPSTSVEVGISKFVDWYKKFYNC